MVVQERQGRSNAWYRPELVVAGEHVDEVARELERLGIALGAIDRSTALGLALVPLVSETDAAARIRDHVNTDRRAGAGEPDPEDPDPDRDLDPDLDPDLDKVLRGLRRHFAHRYAGWVPTVGKNRLLGQVIGGGKISHGGGGAPTAAHEALPRRQAGLGRGVRVGVLDTSISTHPWIAGGWVAGVDDVLSEGDHTAVAGHATFVTGLVLRQAPEAVVEARAVLSDEDGKADSWSVAQEIVELGRRGLDVLNLSFCCYTEDGRAPLVLSAAIERLDPHTVVVAAAGNHGDLPSKQDRDRRKPSWPAALDHVVAVGAADAKGVRAPFTPADVPWIDVLAPGVQLTSTYLHGSVAVGPDGKRADFDGYATWSGTSFAAAAVSGAIAARTEPGRVSARDAWRSLLEDAEGHRPAFLALDA